MNDAKTTKIKIEELHKKACEEGRDFYIDPETGYQVMTALYHRKRGHCCESACRHCPYRGGGGAGGPDGPEAD